MFRRDPRTEEPLSVILGEKCRINSFTFLELADAQEKEAQSKDNLSVLSDNKSYRDRERQVLFQKINEVEGNFDVFTTFYIFLTKC